VNLTAAESRNGIVRLIGTLTANVLVTTLNQGFQIVENMTSGPFSVSFQRNGVGSPVTIPQGTAALIVTDGTSGARIDADNKAEFPSGFSMLCLDAAPPTGWTVQATNNRGIMVNSTSGGALGGSAGFTDIFTTRGLTGTIFGTAITVAQMPPHNHYITCANDDDDFASIPARSNAAGPTVGNTAISTVGGGQAHDHAMSINNLNMSLADIIASGITDVDDVHRHPYSS